jgi:regulator of cell morphogenesis and NO signaling
MFKTGKLYLTPELKVSDVILNNPYLLLLLEHFGIGMPLQEKSIQDICKEQNLNIELFLTFANFYNENNYTPSIQFSFAETQVIVNYLRNSHKYYSEEIYPNIQKTIHTLFATNTHKEVALVEKFFEEYFFEVQEHLKYENEIVFPYIVELEHKVKHKIKIEKKNKYSVGEYKDHHEDIQEKLNDLRNLLIKYLPQENDQLLRRKLLFSLFELEYDLNIHSQIEDTILIPLVSRMEGYLRELD